MWNYQRFKFRIVGDILVFISDLDNTLIFSYKKVDSSGCICVEKKDGKEISFMTEYAYNLLQNIANRVLFVPATTRSLEQYNRVNLLKSRSPSYALVANGGLLLVDGNVDKKWHDESLEIIASSNSELKKALMVLEEHKYIYQKPRIVDEMFVFTKSSNLENTISTLNSKLNLKLVNVMNVGEKVYVLPKKLTKGNAINRLRKILNDNVFLCAGDSEFDISMLESADISIYPSSLEFQGDICIDESGIEYANKMISNVLELI